MLVTAQGRKRIVTHSLTIDGARIHDIPSFYDEINRVFMSDENWKLGASLDALNDMFYGGYGAAKGEEPVVLIWTHMDKSRAALGLDTTRRFYRDKLKHPDIFNVGQIEALLSKLESGEGPTYFEIVLEIIAEHPRIELVAG